jgi:3-phenylpropionate/trans-cinnamate dioxygenase ferredoxin reductase subunit
VTVQSRTDPIVVVGAGHAGCQLASSLREHDYTGRVVLVGDEGAPYQRPPLSKGFLLGALQEDSLEIRTEAFFRDHDIELISERVVRIHAAAQSVELASGATVDYGRLALATGSRNRQLTVPGIDLGGVHQLRSLDEARDLRAAIPGARNVVVIGAGFIGLEFASVARQLGSHVRVIEAAPMVMSRSVSPEIAAHMQHKQQDAGVDFVFDSQVVALHGQSGQVTSISTNRGDEFTADLVLVGIGAVPNSELAAGAGVAVAVAPEGGGILVDNYLRTSDDHIWAIGDCVSHMNSFAGRRVRLESLQNAQDQARCLAAIMTDDGAPYHSVPWFWTDQGDVKLQIAGFVDQATRREYLGDPESGRFSILSFRDDRLCGVESVNHRAYHMAARTLLGSGRPFAREDLLAPGFDFLGAAKTARAARTRS